MAIWRHNQWARLLKAVVPLLLLSGVVGCSDGRPPLYPVSGTVAFDSGSPVRNAMIELVPAEPGPSPRGRVDAMGRFVVGTYSNEDGAPAGDYQVVVMQPVSPGAARNISKLGEEHEEHAAHAGNIQVVALKHASPKTTGITCTVEPVAKNELAIVVEPY